VLELTLVTRIYPCDAPAPTVTTLPVVIPAVVKVVPLPVTVPALTSIAIVPSPYTKSLLPQRA